MTVDHRTTGTCLMPDGRVVRPDKWDQRVRNHTLHCDELWVVGPEFRSILIDRISIARVMRPEFPDRGVLQILPYQRNEPVFEETLLAFRTLEHRRETLPGPQLWGEPKKLTTPLLIREAEVFRIRFANLPWRDFSCEINLHTFESRTP